MDSKEKTAWLSFEAVVKNFSWNEKSRKFCRFSCSIVKSLYYLGCKMSIQLHFINSHLDQFPGQDGNPFQN